MGLLLLNQRIQHLSELKDVGHLLQRGRWLFVVPLLRLCGLIPQIRSRNQKNELLRRYVVPTSSANDLTKFEAYRSDWTDEDIELLLQKSFEMKHYYHNNNRLYCRGK